MTKEEIYREVVTASNPIAKVSQMDIVYELRRIGVTQAMLALELGVRHSVVNNVIHNRVTSHKVAMRVSELLGVPPQVLWPGRYEYRPRSVQRGCEKAPFR